MVKVVSSRIGLKTELEIGTRIGILKLYIRLKTKLITGRIQ